MNRLIGAIVAVAAAGMSGACVSAYGGRPLPGPYSVMRPYPYGYRTAAVQGPVFGRWDNVMLLPREAHVLVLAMDGRKAEGAFVSADARTLAVHTPQGDVQFTTADVMRVDRLPPDARRDYEEAGARGATAGAAMVGIFSLLGGRVAPARVFAGGALLGAAQSIEQTSYVRAPVTIYLAPSADVARRAREPLARQAP